MSAPGLQSETWLKAIRIFNSELTRDPAKRINIAAQPCGSFEDVHDLALQQYERIEQGKWQVKNIVLRDKFDEFLKSIFTYAKAGDVISQSLQYASLAWGCFRFLLQVAADAATTSTQLLEFLRGVIGIFARVKSYETLRGHQIQRLHDAIAKVLAHVLNFLVRARIYFSRSTLGRYWIAVVRPFDAKFRGIIDMVYKSERIVEQESDLCFKQGQTLEVHAATESRLVLGSKVDEAKSSVVLTMQEQELRRKQKAVREWLHPMGVDGYHRMFQCVPSTCDWILRREEYKHWLTSSQESILWLRGKAGCGKTHLMNRIIHSLQKQETVIFYYVDAKAGGDQQWAITLLRSLTFQLLRMDEGLFSLIFDLHTASGSRTVDSFGDFPNLWGVFHSMVIRTPRLVCIIDALDECQDQSRQRKMMMQNFCDLSENLNGQFKLLVSSRENEADIDEVLENRSRIIEVRPMDVTQDVSKFIQHRLFTTESVHLRESSLEEEVKSAILSTTDGMFLWASLMLEDLEMQESLALVRETLRNPPHRLQTIYERALNHVRCKHPNLVELAKFTLSWLACSFRAMRLQELEVARQIVVGRRQLQTDMKPFNLRRTLKQACGPFVRINTDDTVVISHFSAKEYLLGLGSFLQASAALHGGVGRVCFTHIFLDSPGEVGQQAHIVDLDSSYALWDYAMRYWHAHLLRSPRPQAKEVLELTEFFASPQFRDWIVYYDKACTNAINHTFSLHEMRFILSELRDWICGQNRSLGRSTRVALAKLGDSVRVAFHQHLECVQAINGEDSEDVVRLNWFLARLERDEGHLGQAEALFRKALEQSDRIYGPKNAQSLYARNEYARQLSDGGHHDKAAALFEETLAVLEDEVGAEHELTLRTTDSLAYHYTVQGNDLKAEVLFRRAIAGNEKCLGKLHPNTLTPITSFGFHLSSYGKWEEAEPMLQLALSRTEQAVGERHPYHLTATINLGWLRLLQEKTHEALTLFTSVVQGRERIFGPGHPETCGAERFLALTYIRLGDEKKAKDLYAGPSKEESGGFFVHMFQTKVEFKPERHWEGYEKVYEGALAARARFLETHKQGPPLRVMGQT